jgi:hypothetical protein
MLVDVPVDASPAGGACSVATVVMPENGKGDRPVESSGVKVSVGWVEAQSGPPGRRANRQAVADSESVKPRKHFPSEADDGVNGSAESLDCPTALSTGKSHNGTKSCLVSLAAQHHFHSFSFNGVSGPAKA